MNALIYTLGVVAFIIGVAVSIGLHELGHMYPAKKFGIKVTQFFVGFGNTVWSVKRGETEYGIKSIPLGGYVKLVGMLPPAKDADPHEVRKTNTGLFTQLISDARNAEYEHVEDKDLDRLFYRKPWWQKLIVMAGGPMVNILIAIVLFTIVFMGFGALKPTTTVQAGVRLRDQRRRGRPHLHRPTTPSRRPRRPASSRATASPRSTAPRSRRGTSSPS